MPQISPNHPCHRAIVAVDVADSTIRTNTEKIILRRDLYDLFETTLDMAGIFDHYRDPLVDRGDGILALIRPVDQMPKTRLLDTVMPMLGTLLAKHAARH